MGTSQFVTDWLRAIKRNPMRILCRRPKLICPLCNHHGWFVDRGDRKDARCPSCGARERDRIIALYWRRIPWDFQNRDTLHFSQEKSIWPALRHHKRYVTSDVEPHKRASRTLDIQKLCLEDQSFDYVICNHVLEHVPDDGAAMAECFRVMRPGAQGLFSVPLETDRPTTWNPPPGTPQSEIERICGRLHVRLYGLDFPDLLHEHGFEVEETPVSDEDDARHRLRAPRVDKVFVATCPA